MAKYIVKDESGALHVIEAIGFVPEGVVCEAPQDAGSDDGDVIDLETYQDELGLERVRAVVDEAKREAKRAAAEAARAQAEINSEAESYLASTDWLIIREIDSGTACPPEIKQARADARARIVK